MRSRLWIIVACIGAVLLSQGRCSGPDDAPPKPAGGTAVGSRKTIFPLIRVLADPSRLYGSKIEIEAYVSFDGDRFALAADVETLLNSRGPGLVALDLSNCVHKERLKEHGNPALCYLRGIVVPEDGDAATRPSVACTFRAKECTLAVALRPQPGGAAGAPLQGLSNVAPGRAISLIPVLADPRRFDKQEVVIEAFFSHDRGQYVLAPNLVSIANSMGPSLVTLDLKECLHKDRLQQHGNPALCHIRGVIDARDFGPLEHSPAACTLRARECILVAPLRHGR